VKGEVRTRRNVRNEEIEFYEALAKKKTFCIFGLCLEFVFSEAEKADLEVLQN